MAIGIRLSVVLDVSVDNGVYATVRVLTRIPVLANRARPTPLKASNDPTATASETSAVTQAQPTHFEQVDTIFVNKTQNDGTPTTKAQIALAALAFSQSVILRNSQTIPTAYPGLIGAGSDGTSFVDAAGNPITPTQPATVSVVFPTDQHYAEFADTVTHTVTSGSGPEPFGQ